MIAGAQLLLLNKVFARTLPTRKVDKGGYTVNNDNAKFGVNDPTAYLIEKNKEEQDMYCPPGNK